MSCSPVLGWHFAVSFNFLALFLFFLVRLVHVTLSYVSDLLFSITCISPPPSKGECHRLCAKPQSLSIYVRHEERDRRLSLSSVWTWVRTTNLLNLTVAVNSVLIHRRPRRDTLFHSNFTQLRFDLFILIAPWFSLLSWLESYLTATAVIINRQTSSLRGIIGIWEESIRQQILHLSSMRGRGALTPPKFALLVHGEHRQQTHLGWNTAAHHFCRKEPSMLRKGLRYRDSRSCIVLFIA